jgi:hypothetical protein
MGGVLSIISPLPLVVPQKALRERNMRVRERNVKS